MKAASPLFTTIGDTALIFGISRATLYRLSDEGLITLRKFRRRTLVDVSSVNEFFKALPTAPTHARRPSSALKL